MDPIEVLQPLHLPIDIVMIILVLLSGIFQKKYLEDVKIHAVYKTLMVSFVFCMFYSMLFILAYKFQKELPLRWFFSYVTGTSLYELLLKKLMKKYFPDEPNP